MNVKKLRRKFGLTQAELADKIGVSQSTVAGWESGKPPDGPARRLLEFLESAGDFGDQKHRELEMLEQYESSMLILRNEISDALRLIPFLLGVPVFWSKPRLASANQEFDVFESRWASTLTGEFRIGRREVFLSKTFFLGHNGKYPEFEEGGPISGHIELDEETFDWVGGEVTKELKREIEKQLM